MYMYYDKLKQQYPCAVISVKSWSVLWSSVSQTESIFGFTSRSLIRTQIIEGSFEKYYNTKSVPKTKCNS